MSIRILVGKLIINIFSIYTPQTDLSFNEKDSFYRALLSSISTVSPDEYLLVLGDFNGHLRKAPEGFNRVHGGRGFGSRNGDGIRILDLCAAANLATSTYFMKPNNHLVTYRSRNSCTQVDYILTRRSDLKEVQNVKVIGDEECVTQHKLLVCQITLRTQIRKQHQKYVSGNCENLRFKRSTKKLSRKALIPQLCYLIQIQKQILNQSGQKLNLV